MAENQKVERVFEIGLVMAGAVSAGAYTAGVIDFLLQALDAWEAEKKKESSTMPHHKIKIKVIAGASAGGMTAAMFAAELCKRASGLHKKDEVSVGFKSWVEDIDISFLLEDKDLQRGPVKSILDSTQIDTIAEDAIGKLSSTHWEASKIPYVDERLKLYLTLGNLRGLPYSYSMAGESHFNFGMMNHADYQYVEIGAGTTKEDWGKLKNAAKATGAFPIGLASRVIKRNTGEYKDRITFDGSNLSRFLEMSTDDRPYHFVAVDGGTLNNEPIELAEAALIRPRSEPRTDKPKDSSEFVESRKRMREMSLSILKHEREMLGATPSRKDKLAAEIRELQRAMLNENFMAIIMVDPFPNINPETVDADEEKDTALIKIIGNLFNALRDQSLFRPQQLLLSSSYRIPNRFLVAPVRYKDGARVLNPIASGFLGGFGGFFSKTFREHDYNLGKRNCQKFLKDHFVLPLDIAEANLKVHADSQYIIENDEGKFYPIIPLVPELQKVIDQPTWPQYSAMEEKQLKRKIKSRVRALLNAFLPWLTKYNLAIYIVGALTLMMFIFLERYMTNNPAYRNELFVLLKVLSVITSFSCASILAGRTFLQLKLTKVANRMTLKAMKDHLDPKKKNS